MLWGASVFNKKLEHLQHINDVSKELLKNNEGGGGDTFYIMYYIMVASFVGTNSGVSVGLEDTREMFIHLFLVVWPEPRW